MNKIKNSLENEVIKLLTTSIYQPINKTNITDHPIRVFEAIKSLVGINLNQPQTQLISYLKKKKLIKSDPMNFNKIRVKEMTSIYQLERAIRNHETGKINDIINILTQLSDGKHVLEFLLELSLQQSGKSLLVLWPIYRAMNFISYEDVDLSKQAITLSAHCIVNDTFIRHSNTADDINQIFDSLTLSMNQLHISGVLYEIFNSSFIRSESIKKYRDHFISYLYNSISVNNIIESQNNIIFKGSRESLVDLLLENKLNDNKILTTNSIRAYMKNSYKINKSAIQHYINNFLL